MELAWRHSKRRRISTRGGWAIREIKEELGLTFQPEDLRLAVIAYRFPWKGFKDSFYLTFDGGIISSEQIASIKLQEKELDEYRFIDVGKMSDYLDPLKANYVEHLLKDQTKTWYLESTEPFRLQ